MRYNKKQNTYKGVLYGGLNKIVSLLFPFIVRSLLIKKLGIEYVGLNTIFASILSILSFTELGFGQVMIYSLYKPIAQNDTKKICALYNFYKKVYKIIGLVMLILGLAFLPFIKFFVSTDCPEGINLYLLYGIYLFNAVISYWLFAYKDCLLSAHQQYYISSIALLIVTILKSVLEIIVILVWSNYLVYVIVLPFSTVVYNLIISVFADKKFPQYVCKGEISKEEEKTIGKTVAAGIGHKLGPSATASIDNVVVSSFLGVTALGIYSNYSYVQNSVVAFFSIWFTSMSAGIGNSLETDSIEKNYTDFNNLTFINNFMVGLCSICLLCLYQPFMILWVGSEMAYSGMLTIVLLSVMFYTQQMRSVVTTYKSAAGMWRIDRLKPYITALMNLILDLILVNICGINGIVLSTILARSAIGLPWETNALFRELFKRSPKRYYIFLIKNTIIWIVIGITAFYLTSLISIYGVLGFIIKALFCCMFSAILFLAFQIKNPSCKYLIGLIQLIIKRT